MSVMREIPWGECLLPRASDPEFVRDFKEKSGGRPAGALLHFMHVPWVGRGLGLLSARLSTRVHVEHELADLIGLVVSQDNSCRYCFATQRAMMRVLGFSERRIEQLEHGLLLADLDPAVRAALTYARTISRSNPLPTVDDAAPLRDAGFDDDTIREIAFLTAVHTIFNRAATIVALPPQTMEALPDRWWSRLLQPLLRPTARKFLKRDQKKMLREEEKTGPWSFVIVALDGHPGAGELRQVMDELWASPLLTRRCKALLFAVIARSLECRASEKEALGIVRDEGMSEEQIARILDHLDVDGLTPQEQMLVPFSRETVWYDTPRLQALSRKVEAALRREEFVEAVAVVSIANAVCRLGASLLRPAAEPRTPSDAPR